MVFRDARTGLESIRSCREIRERGLRVTLDAYEGHVFWEFREVHDGSAGQWARLAATLGDRAVPSLEDAMTELQLEPFHVPLRAIFDGDLVRAVLAARTGPADLDGLERRFAAFLTAIATATGVPGDPVGVAASVRERTERGFSVAAPTLPADRATLLGWLALSRTGELAPAADVAATSRAWFDELRLIAPLAAGYRTAGLDEGEAWAVADRVRVLLRLPRPSGIRGPKRTADARLLEAGSPTTSSGPRSASTPGKASSGSIATASPRCSAGRRASTRSKPTRRRTPPWPGAGWQPPRRQAIGWMRCGPRSRDRRPRSRQAAKPGRKPSGGHPRTRSHAPAPRADRPDGGSVAAGACTSTAASPAPEPTQPHPEWRLVESQLSGNWPTLQVAQSGETDLSVLLIVSGGCPDGGPATPSFAGFSVHGDTMEALVSRTPIPSDRCIVHGGRAFDVLLDLRAVPVSVRTVTLGGEACPAGDDFCAAVVAPLPVKGLASPSG